MNGNVSKQLLSRKCSSLFFKQSQSQNYVRIYIGFLRAIHIKESNEFHFFSSYMMDGFKKIIIFNFNEFKKYWIYNLIRAVC